VVTGKKKEEYAKTGSKHEDWHMVKQLKKEGRYGYLVFRFSFEVFQDFPSIVNKVAENVSANQKIPLDDQIDEEGDD